MFGNFLFLGTTEKKTFGKVYEIFSSGVKNWFLGKYKKIIGDTEPVLGNLILLEENDPLHRTI